jgi:hypothetical protein
MIGKRLLEMEGDICCLRTYRWILAVSKPTVSKLFRNAFRDVSNQKKVLRCPTYFNFEVAHLYRHPSLYNVSVLKILCDSHDEKQSTSKTITNEVK